MNFRTTIHWGHHTAFTAVLLFALGVLLPRTLFAAIDLEAIVPLVNQEREQHGVAPLLVHPLLEDAAEAKLKDMDANDYFRHFSPAGTAPWDFMDAAGYTYTFAGENLAMDYEDAAQAVQAWTNSSSHRNNLLNPSYKHIGVAAGVVSMNGVASVVIVQMFGAGGPSLPLSPAIPTVAGASLTPPGTSPPATGQQSGAHVISAALLLLGGSLLLAVWERRRDPSGGRAPGPREESYRRQIPSGGATVGSGAGSESLQRR